MGYKSCDGGGSISAKNQVCVKKSEKDCPITSLIFAKKGDGDLAGYAYKDFDSEYRIGISKSYDAMPLARFQVSPEKPCISS